MRYRKKEENLYRQENIGDYYILKTSKFMSSLYVILFYNLFVAI